MDKPLCASFDILRVGHPFSKSSQQIRKFGELDYRFPPKARWLFIYNERHDVPTCELGVLTPARYA
jgi:hypothetical protein